MITQISVFLQNHSGTLRALTRTLAASAIDLMALSVADTADFGVVRIVVREKDLERACGALREAGYMAKTNHVLCVSVPNRPAGLDEVLAVLEKAALSVEYMYSFNYSVDGNALMILRLSDQTNAEELLASSGIRLVTQEEINRL